VSGFGGFGAAGLAGCDAGACDKSAVDIENARKQRAEIRFTWKIMRF
jgi:hypothetical protein